MNDYMRVSTMRLQIHDILWCHAAGPEGLKQLRTHRMKAPHLKELIAALGKLARELGCLLFPTSCPWNSHSLRCLLNLFPCAFRARFTLVPSPYVPSAYSLPFLCTLGLPSEWRRLPTFPVHCDLSLSLIHHSNPVLCPMFSLLEDQ